MFLVKSMTQDAGNLDRRHAMADGYMKEVREIYKQDLDDVGGRQFLVLLEGTAYYGFDSTKATYLEELVDQILNRESLLAQNPDLISFYDSFSADQLDKLVRLLKLEIDRLTARAKEEEIKKGAENFEREEGAIKNLKQKDFITDTPDWGDNHPYYILCGEKKYINFFGFKYGDELHLSDGDWVIIGCSYGDGLNGFSATINLVRPQTYRELDEAYKDADSLKGTNFKEYLRKLQEIDSRKYDKKVILQTDLKELRDNS